MVLIDLSRNIHNLDDHKKVHEKLISAFIFQYTNHIEKRTLFAEKQLKKRKNYLETFIFTTNSEDVIEMYKELYN